MAIKFTDNAQTKLAVDITSTDTIITLQAGTGQLFPAVDGTSGDYFVITLEDSSGNREFVRVDYRQGDTLGNATYPCQRGYWGSTAQAFSASNTVVAVRLSANALDRAIADHAQWATKADKVSPVTAGNLAGLDAAGNLMDSGVTFGTAANNVLQLDASGLVPLANIPSVLTGKDADTVDGAHAGTGANNVLQLDASGLVPLANIPSVLTGKDADTVDGSHAGTGPNEVLKLDVSGLVPLANIPSVLTGKDADTVDGMHLADLDNRYVNVTGDKITGLLELGDQTAVAPGVIFHGSNGGYAEFRYGAGWRGRIRADGIDGLNVQVFDGTNWVNKLWVRTGFFGLLNAYLAVRRDGTHIEHRNGSDVLKFLTYYDPITDALRFMTGDATKWVAFHQDGSWTSNKPAASGFVRVTPNFCLASSASWMSYNNAGLKTIVAPLGAKVIVLKVELWNVGDGVNTSFDLLLAGLNGSTNTSPVVDAVRSRYWHAPAPSSGLVVHGISSLMFLPVQSDGNVYVDFIFYSGNGITNFTIVGYFD